MIGWRMNPALWNCCYLLKGETVMVAAFGAFGAIYLAGMIAMTVRGMKN